jgi:hypothetical protein
MVIDTQMTGTSRPRRWPLVATSLAALAAVWVGVAFVLTFTISWYTSETVTSDGARTVAHESLWSNAPHGVLIAIFGIALALTLAAMRFPRLRGLAAALLFTMTALLALTVGWLFLPSALLLVIAWVITVRTVGA